MTAIVPQRRIGGAVLALVVVAAVVLLVALVYGRAQGGRVHELSSRLRRAEARGVSAEFAVRRLERENGDLEQQVKTLTERLAAEQARTGRLAAAAGTNDVQGPGLLIELRDNVAAELTTDSGQASIVHAVDLLELISDLANAGAQALAVNDQRVASVGAISCSGPVIRINGRTVRSPYTLTAVGDSGALARAARRDGGVMDKLRRFSVSIRVTEKSALRVPALRLPEAEVESPAQSR